VRPSSIGLAFLFGAALGLPALAPAVPLDEVLREHRGRVVVASFWAAWCAPCRKELPLLARLQREYADRGVQFVGVSTDAPEAVEAAKALAERSGVSFPIVFGGTEEGMRALGMGALLPATAVYDRDGTRTFRIVGEVTRKGLVERLEWLLGTRADHPPRLLVLPGGVNAGDYEEPRIVGALPGGVAAQGCGSTSIVIDEGRAAER
jgi:thiol-disulfide isomerase/thioredoxin